VQKGSSLGEREACKLAPTLN